MQGADTQSDTAIRLRRRATLREHYLHRFCGKKRVQTHCMNHCITATAFRKRSHSKELACAHTGVRRLWWRVHPATAPKCGSQTSDELAFSGECRIKTGKNSSHSPENTFFVGGFYGEYEGENRAEVARGRRTWFTRRAFLDAVGVAESAPPGRDGSLQFCVCGGHVETYLLRSR